MFKKILLLFLFIFLFFFFVFVVWSQEETEKRILSIYFREKQIGYEEYFWQSDENGYLLSVKGRMTEPVTTEIENLTISMDKNFVPFQFYFKGSVSGASQEISSSFADGRVENTIQFSGQEQKSTAQIKRGAFILLSAVFSPYIVMTKKFGCSLQEPVELYAYIVPLYEVPFTLKPKEESLCSLIMHIGGLLIELEMDDEGNLEILRIPSQSLKVIQKKT